MPVWWSSSVSIHGLLRALTLSLGLWIEIPPVSIHGLLRALTFLIFIQFTVMGFNPRALTSPDCRQNSKPIRKNVSIHGLLRALTYIAAADNDKESFNTRALTSPDVAFNDRDQDYAFQSTGSYEP